LILNIILIWLIENEEPLVPKTTIEHEHAGAAGEVII
jgi:hypothetical protein